MSCPRFSQGRYGNEQANSRPAKFHPLHDHLADLKSPSVVLGFAEVEQIIGAPCRHRPQLIPSGGQTKHPQQRPTSNAVLGCERDTRRRQISALKP